MEIKDILGLAFTFLFLVAFQFLGRSKKKPSQVMREPSAPISRKKEKPPVKKAPHKPLSTLEKSSSFVKNVEAYTTKKRQQRSVSKSLLQDKNSLKKAFIIQQVLNKPYD